MNKYGGLNVSRFVPFYASYLQKNKKNGVRCTSSHRNPRPHLSNWATGFMVTLDFCLSGLTVSVSLSRQGRLVAIFHFRLAVDDFRFSVFWLVVDGLYLVVGGWR